MRPNRSTPSRGALRDAAQNVLRMALQLALALAVFWMMPTASRAEGLVAPQYTDSLTTKFAILPLPQSDFPTFYGTTPIDVCTKWTAFIATKRDFENLGGTYWPEALGWAFCGIRGSTAAGYLDATEIQVPQCPSNSDLQWYVPPVSPAPPPVVACVCKAGTGPHVSGSNASLPNECVPVNNLRQTHKRCPECEARFGKPIFPLTGAERLTIATGLRIAREPLSFTYDSMRTPPLAAGTFPGFSTVEPVTMGANWLSSLERRLAWSGAYVIEVTRGDGKVSTFTRQPNWSMGAEAGSRDTLSVPGPWRFIDGTRRQVEEFESWDGPPHGKLLRIATPDGRSIGLHYSDASTDPAGAINLLTASDSFGRHIDFSYTGKLLTRVSDMAGRSTDLSYDAQSRLTRISWPDGTSDQFLYENPSLPWALTGQIDANGVRYATIGYDAEGRAISTELAGGVQRYSVSYGSAPVVQAEDHYDDFYRELVRTWSWQAPQGTTINLPNGGSTAMASAKVGGYPRTAGQTQAAGSGSGASSRVITHDANGNVASSVDFEGRKSCFVNDLPRNLETLRVEGLPGDTDCATVSAANASLPANSHKTSTQWHPQWMLPTVVAEPGKITTSVYNGQRDPFTGGTAACTPPDTYWLDFGPIVVLCKQVEQSTTDVDGLLGFSAGLQPGAVDRVWTWAYNADAQVLAARGPRNGTRTNTYFTDTTADHTRGDLQSITDAQGNVTTFTRYDPYGNVLESTEPNGALTVNTYDLRQRLLTRTTGGKTTTFTYDAVGQLKKASLPNGGWVGFDYDDAHRQVAVLDDAGNRIDYVLDNAGNRTDERVKDPLGALKRSLARVTDALDRVQQSTGRE